MSSGVCCLRERSRRWLLPPAGALDVRVDVPRRQGFNSTVARGIGRRCRDGALVGPGPLSPGLRQPGGAKRHHIALFGQPAPCPDQDHSEVELRGSKYWNQAMDSRAPSRHSRESGNPSRSTNPEARSLKPSSRLLKSPVVRTLAFHPGEREAARRLTPSVCPAASGRRTGSALAQPPRCYAEAPALPPARSSARRSALRARGSP